MGSKLLLETLRDTGGSAHPEVLEALWAAIPERFRRLEMDSRDLPPEDMAAFTSAGLRGRHSDFRLRFHLLAVPLDRELAWCCYRIIELGGRVPVGSMQSLIRWLAATVEDHPAFRGSMMDHVPREWERVLAATYARREGKLPGKSWLLNTMALVRRCYRMLWAAYDQRPWWRREEWNLALDRRIPRRPQRLCNQFAQKGTNPKHRSLAVAAISGLNAHDLCVLPDTFFVAPKTKLILGFHNGDSFPESEDPAGHSKLSPSTDTASGGLRRNRSANFWSR